MRLAITILLLAVFGAAAPAEASTGGTLRILSAADDVDFDPARSSSSAISLPSLVLRRLNTWDARPGKPTLVTPDLATDTGRSDDGGRTWTHTLKPGLKYADGSPITSADIKFGVERTFAAKHSGGLGYHRSLLAGGADYRGPYDGEKLDSIETPDDRTIVFRLRMAYRDWPWIASMAAFVPVPESKDEAVASGPYQIALKKRDKRAELIRNPHWDRASDPIRTAEPDRIVMELGQSAEEQARRLVADAGKDRYAIGTALLPTDTLKRIHQSSELHKRLITSAPDALEYLAMNTTRGPLAVRKVRQAMQYAIDKRPLMQAYGEYTTVEYASALIGPGMPGRVDYQLYAKDPSGDVATARRLLAEAGHADLKLTLSYDDEIRWREEAETIARGLARAGIAVTLKPIVDPAEDFELRVSAWLADYPNPAASIHPLFTSRGSDHNITGYADPEVDAAMDRAFAEADPVRAQAQWASLDRRIMRDAPVVPLLYSGISTMHGSRVENLTATANPHFLNYLRLSLRSDTQSSSH
ncbi:peptide/nickel transport system substrate-binding protein [Actinoplanes lutulentus]|uniref:Peptide/nickel transport system substrate-binding protein n=1 Tax=Actinoplanes lutulentus TaxID=1287878 RepID=A0A327Z9I9_9ACTN|nr:ABC transporter substrate-binding protein [Actinoplanes lutulentus]MBB2946793.1 peptide/nickel transport system substrate-binding protein [Actinoplanes lutulentus]RAK35685.1 peptide/nickel transport system substrate-binding protein [Actinoplanes lutulentus]